MLKEILLDTRCIICGSKDLSKDIKYICNKCLQSFDYKLENLCPICGHPLFDNQCLSHSQLGEIFFDSYRYIQTYTGFFKSITYKLKKNDEFMINKLLFDLLIRNNFFNKNIPITIVSDSAFKAFRRGRGSLYFVLSLLKKSGYKTIKNIYKKRISFHSQKSKSRQERINEIKNVYYLPDKNVNAFSGEIYLLDDIYTTGATLNYGAKLLKEAGFSKVHCVSFFRAIIGDK